MRFVPVEKLVSGLRSIGENEFSVENVYQFLSENPVESDTLAPYAKFSCRFYTRNLIYKSELFEIMAVCWDVGQVSRIHDHAKQNCWMAVPVGRLRVKNFKLLEMDEASKFARLEFRDAIEIDANRPDKIDLEEPIHQVRNEAEFSERAVSLHVYSRPINSCRVFSVPGNEFMDVKMCYTSMYGKLCDGMKL